MKNQIHYGGQLDAVIYLTSDIRHRLLSVYISRDHFIVLFPSLPLKSYHTSSRPVMHILVENACCKQNIQLCTIHTMSASFEIPSSWMWLCASCCTVLRTVLRFGLPVLVFCWYFFMSSLWWKSASPDRCFQAIKAHIIFWAHGFYYLGNRHRLKVAFRALFCDCAIHIHLCIRNNTTWI